MYDNSLENAAYDWEMLKVAKKTNAPLKDRTMADLGTAGLARASKMTGFRDIKNALEMSKALREAKGGMNAAELEAFKNLGKPGAEVRSAADSLAARKGMKGMGPKNIAGFNARQMADFRSARRGYALRGAGKAGATIAAVTGLGLGAKKLMDKKSSYDPMVEAVEELEGWEFAKEAEFRAAEILLANGIDPETFEETYPEHVKIASFPDPEDAYTDEGEGALEAYNEILDEAALDIIEELGLI